MYLKITNYVESFMNIMKIKYLFMYVSLLLVVVSGPQINGWKLWYNYPDTNNRSSSANQVQLAVLFCGRSKMWSPETSALFCLQVNQIWIVILILHKEWFSRVTEDSSITIKALVAWDTIHFVEITFRRYK